MSLDLGDEARRKLKGKAFEGERLFFAIRPSPKAKAEARTVATRYREDFALRGELRFNLLHVTLIMVAEEPRLPEDVIFAAKQAAATIGGAPVPIHFDHIMSFRKENEAGQRRALVLHGDGGRTSLTRLHVSLGVGMHNAGLGHNLTGSYTPHMTLLYDHKSVPPRELEEPVCWTADEFVLIRSVLGKSTHHVVDRWPLLG